MIQEIQQLRNEQGCSWSEIGRTLGIDRRTAQRRYYKAEEGIGPAAAEPGEVVFPSNMSPYIDEKALFDNSRFAPMVAGGDMMVTCDWHIPLHDPRMVNKLILKARDEQITTLVIGGDYWDMTSYSHYAPNQMEAPFQVERRVGVDIMNILTDTFEKIYMFWGNHDYRFLRVNEHRFSFIYGMQMLLEPIGPDRLSQIQFSDLDYMHLEQDNIFRFSHQKNFSKIPLTVPRQLAQKYNMSIITAHSHHCSMGVALDGKNIIIEGGGLFNKYMTEYVQKTTTHHEWVQGLTMFQDGLPSIYSPVFGNI